MGPKTESGAIVADLDGGILTITIDRPDRLNAMTRIMGADIVNLLDFADTTDEVRAVIITGAGRAFCAGADVSGSKQFGTATGESARFEPDRDYGGVISIRMFECSKPIIAAINGDAVGVGASMLLAADVRLASPGARFGFVQVKRGIAPEGCFSWFLPRIVGISKALEWACSGRLFSAQEAEDAGLVTCIRSTTRLLDAARAKANEITHHTPPVSVGVTRRMLWTAMTMAHPMEAHRMETKIVRALGARPDAAEGIRSFLERRAPDFTGSPAAAVAEFNDWWQSPPFSNAAPVPAL